MRKTLSTLGIILGGSLLTDCSKPTATTTETPTAQVVNEFPNMILSRADGTQQRAKDLKGNSILIIYFTECDHCQREATEIANKLKAFEKYDLWFLSTDPFPNIERFANDYKLVNQPNVHFARIEFEDVATYFGSIPTPSVYIYSESRKLVKAIKGETPVDNIIQYL
jgi:thiol-disulfide isomerase/thioredoxin